MNDPYGRTSRRQYREIARKFAAHFCVMIHSKLKYRTGGNRMSTLTSDPRAVPAGEPRPIIPPLSAFYWHARDLGWLVVRLTAGGMLLVHGIMKVMPMAQQGFAATIGAFATGSMARRGIEPAMFAAYVVFFIETIGAVLIILGLFTRFIAAAAAIEFAVITFVAHWPQGFTWSRGGWEYPLFWGLILFAIALRGGGPYSLDRKLGWEL
jgi:putative oxidoreductase